MIAFDGDVKLRRTSMTIKKTFFLLAGAALLISALSSCDAKYRAGRGPERITPPDNSIPHWVLHPPLSQQYVYGVGTDLRGRNCRRAT
jgi:hypothetical protein